MIKIGYYTRFTLSTLTDEVDVDELFNDFIEEDYYHSHGGSVAGGESTKWYEHERDMTALSKLYPTVVFILDGEGEELGDQWRTFYVNGESETHKAKWVAPDRPEKLTIPTYVPKPKPKVLHVPADHILHAVLDGKEYDPVSVLVAWGDHREVTVGGQKVLVMAPWLDEGE